MLPDRFLILSPLALQELREYLGTFKWKRYRENIKRKEQSEDDTEELIYLDIMRALPIYEVYGNANNINSKMSFLN